MRKRIATVSIIAIAAGTVMAANPSTLNQAKEMANRQKKPILIEFSQPDCEFCQLAANDFAVNDSIIEALKSVVYCPVDVNSEEGEKLSAIYYVQSEFPVFALTDSSGEIIDHWTGYNNPAIFVATLKRSISSPMTIKARYEMLTNSPNVDNIIFLAKYNDEIGDNVKSAELYRRAQSLRKEPAYVYDIFQSTANAVWKGELEFDRLYPAADDVLVLRAGNVTQVAGVARIISNVARKTGNTAKISKYLKAGLDITAGRDDIRSREWHALFSGDMALYAENDTARAISIEKESLGAGWENKPSKFYSFARWCRERKINLPEAESFARKAVEQSSEGKFRGSILVTLAGIYEARGKIPDAAETMRLAVAQDPSNTWYNSEEKRLQALLNKGK